MTTTAEPPVSPAASPPATGAPTNPPLNRAEGVELLGDIHGCGYRNGASLVRRADGQMVQLGQLMYALLECVDGSRDTRELAAALSERLGKRVDEEHVARLEEKLASQGLLSGTEHKAPPRRNPLLALRWKVLVTNPAITRRLTAPFTVLFRPWLMWPVIACFAVVFWFVLIHKGVASATADAFHSPGMLLLVFALAVVSAGFHELGHAAAARYAGATPGGMGMGLYLVWPAFYTDVTDTYRLPKRDRLRVDLAGLYFNALVAVITLGVWLAVRADALLLLVALQVLQMVKQLSPVIRADGYHILSDWTGVPDLFGHMVPTLRRLVPGGRREPSALTGRARLLVTLWVLVVVPVMLALMLGAILLLPRIATTAWESGGHILGSLPHQVDHAQVIDVLASLLGLLALLLPVAGSVLVTQKILRSTGGRVLGWSRGRPARRAVLAVAAICAVAAAAWAWWPSGQYQPIRANQGGTIPGLVNLVSAPVAAARPSPAPGPVALTRGTHLAVAMIPVGGASRRHPALFIIPGKRHEPAVAIVSTSTPKLPPGLATVGGSGAAPTGTVAAAGASTTPTTSTPTTTSSTTATPATSSPAPSSSSSTTATAFPFKLPAAPGPGGTQALAVGTKDGGVTYDVAYTLITVGNGAPVTNSNGAFALANCNACTTIAVSFQVVLVVGQSKDIAPINAAGALNYNCPACVTTAIADQIVVTLKSQPSAALVAQLGADLKQLDALPTLGAAGTPAAVASQVASVQQQIDSQLAASGLLTNPPAASNTSTTGSTTATTSSPTSTSGSSTTSTSTTPTSSTPTSTSTTTSSTTTSTTTAPTTQTSPTTTSSGSASDTNSTSTSTTP